MAKKRKSKRSNRKSSTTRNLMMMFRLSREQLAQRKMTGGGLHRTRHDVPRSEQKRRAINDQRDEG